MKKEVKNLIQQADSLLANSSEAKTDDLKGMLSKITSTLENEKSTPWWVVLLKVIAYAIGLILAGYGTTAAAMTINTML
jgi:hypothetical protein